VELNRILQEIACNVSSAIDREFPHGGGGEKIAIGADGDHTREIDKIAEDVILDCVKNGNYGWNVCSEEAGWIEKGNDLTLVIDPVDGTHNAISAIPFFSTSLALIDNTRKVVVEAVVMNLATGQIYHSTRGKGAFRDGEPIRVRPMMISEAVVSSYIGPEAREWANELMNWPMRTRYFGSISLEVCLVASGSLDMFAMFGRIPRLTDIAPSTLILEEAGGGSFLMDDRNNIILFDPSFDRTRTKAFFSMGDPLSLEHVLHISKVEHNLEGSN
jgi:fructose-1,6-bisphosphatase/inositol monophosphatase family enzyme